MNIKKNVLKKSVSALLCSLCCSSSSQAAGVRMERSVSWPEVDSIRSLDGSKSFRLRSKGDLERNKSLADKVWDFAGDHPWMTLAGVALTAGATYNWALHPLWNLLKRCGSYIIHPSYRQLANYIGRSVNLIVKTNNNKIYPSDLESLGKDLDDHKGWVTDSKNLKTLIKLWEIEVKLEPDNVFKAAGKAALHFTVYPAQPGNGISRDDKNVLKGSDDDSKKDNDYPLLVHNGEAFDKHLEVSDAIFPTLSKFFNRLDSFSTRLVSTDYIVAQILHLFYSTGKWGAANVFKNGTNASVGLGQPDNDMAANAGRRKGDDITYLHKAGNHEPVAYDQAYHHGTGQMKDLGQTDIGPNKLNTKGAVWNNKSAFFIKIPPAARGWDLNGFIRELKSCKDKDGENSGYRYAFARFIDEKLSHSGNCNDSDVLVFRY